MQMLHSVKQGTEGIDGTYRPGLAERKEGLIRRRLYICVAGRGPAS